MCEIGLLGPRASLTLMATEQHREDIPEGWLSSRRRCSRTGFPTEFSAGSWTSPTGAGFWVQAYTKALY